MTNILAMKFSIGEYVLKTLRGVTLLINLLVYNIVGIMYRIFYLVTKVRIFDFNDPNTIGAISRRIYVVLGVVMLFVLAVNVLRLIVDPDKLTSTDDKSLVGIAKNTVISIALITALPFLINLLDRVQERVIDSNIIGNIILMSGSDPEAVDNDFKEGDRVDIKDAGYRVATTVFSAFFHPIDSDGNTITPAECRSKEGLDSSLGTVCDKYIEKYDLALKGKLGKFFLDSDLNDYISDEKMEYFWLWAMGVGGFVAYLFLSFAIDVGVRSVKLMALELVAPIPIILRITKPTGGVFTKWFNEVKSTYLLVFIRIATIYFAIYTLALIRDSGHFWNTIDTSYGTGLSLTRLIAKIIIYISILNFAKTAPKLLDNIAGGLAKGEWRIGKKLNGEDYEYARRGMSAVGTLGSLAGRGLFNNMFRQDENGNYVMRRGERIREAMNRLGSAGSFGQAAGMLARGAGRAVGAGFRGVGHTAYAARQGWTNGGGNLENLRGEVAQSVTESVNHFEQGRQRRERMDAASEATAPGPGASLAQRLGHFVTRQVPGVRNLAMKVDDIHDAVNAEGGFANYVGSRVNYLGVDQNAQVAGNINNELKQITKAETVQRGVEKIKEAFKAERAAESQIYNGELRQVRNERNAVMSTTEYTDYQARMAGYEAEKETIRRSDTAGYAAYSAEKTRIENERTRLAQTDDGRHYMTQLRSFEATRNTEMARIDQKESALRADITRLNGELAAVNANTTMTAAAKTAEINRINAEISTKNAQITTDIPAERAAAQATFDSSKATIDASGVGIQFARLDQDERDNNATAIGTQLLTVEGKIQIENSTGIGKQVQDLDHRETVIRGNYTDRVAQINKDEKAAIDAKIIENLKDVSDDIHAYLIANRSTLMDEIDNMTVESRVRVLSKAGVPGCHNDGTADPNVNIRQEFANIITRFMQKPIGEDYTPAELKLIRDIMDGLKEEEVRGALRKTLNDRLWNRTGGNNKDGGGH